MTGMTMDLDNLILRYRATDNGKAQMYRAIATPDEDQRLRDALTALAGDLVPTNDGAKTLDAIILVIPLVSDGP